MSQVKTYDECRDITRHFHSQQLMVLLVTARHRLKNQVLATREWFQKRETWIEALEDELAERVDLIEEGVK